MEELVKKISGLSAGKKPSSECETLQLIEYPKQDAEFKKGVRKMLNPNRSIPEVAIAMGRGEVQIISSY